MKEIIFGTSNPAKITQVKGALAGLEIDIKGLDGFDNLPDVIEDGQTAQENARIKALAFAKATGKIVFSMDNALYLDGLSEDEQPGINVRRIPGVEGRPTDEQMLEYFAGVIKRLGNEIKGRWEFAIAVANLKGIIEEITICSPRFFRSQLSRKVVQGYPLESLQVDPKSGKYIADMTQEEQGQFWQEAIGKELRELFSELIPQL